MYELIQTILNKQQKPNKTHHIIQVITIVLCVLSLFFNISMRKELAKPKGNIEAQSRFDFIDDIVSDKCVLSRIIRI